MSILIVGSRNVCLYRGDRYRYIQNSHFENLADDIEGNYLKYGSRLYA